MTTSVSTRMAERAARMYGVRTQRSRIAGSRMLCTSMPLRTVGSKAALDGSFMALRVAMTAASRASSSEGPNDTEVSTFELR